MQTLKPDISSHFPRHLMCALNSLILLETSLLLGSSAWATTTTTFPVNMQVYCTSNAMLAIRRSVKSYNVHLTREHKWPQKALLLRLHREKTFSLPTSDRSLASVVLVHLMWRERHASKPNGPVVLRSKQRSQDDALDTQTYSFYIWTHRHTPFIFFF